MYESYGTYSIVAIFSQNIYCFVGSCEAHPVPSLQGSQGLHIHPSISFYLLKPVLPSLPFPSFKFFISYFQPNILAIDSCAFCYLSFSTNSWKQRCLYLQYFRFCDGCFWCLFFFFVFFPPLTFGLVFLS